MAKWATTTARDAACVIPQSAKDQWHAFLAEHRNWTLPQVEAQIATLQQRFEQVLAEGRLESNRNHKRRQSRNRTKVREAAE